MEDNGGSVGQKERGRIDRFWVQCEYEEREESRMKLRFWDLANWVVERKSGFPENMINSILEKLSFKCQGLRVGGIQMEMSNGNESRVQVSHGLAFEGWHPAAGIMPFLAPLIAWWNCASWMPKCLWHWYTGMCGQLQILKFLGHSPGPPHRKEIHMGSWLRRGGLRKADLSCCRQLKCFLSDGWMVEAITLTVICNGSLTL